MINLGPEDISMQSKIEHLLNLAFRQKRFLNPSHKFRNNSTPVRDLCFVAKKEKEVIGTIRFTSIIVGNEKSAALLGPIAVSPVHQGQGIGSYLMELGISVVRNKWIALALAIGDPSYLSRFGFQSANTYELTFPNLYESEKLMILKISNISMKNI